MELLYNPDSMPEEEVKATFVARQWLVGELISLIKRQPDGAGVQHVLIIAPRGMGKTTVLLMAKFAINDGTLSRRWQAVKFPEESYGVYDLSDFWIEVLNIIAADTKDDELHRRAEELKSDFPDNNDLHEAGLALIKDWRRKHKKRLVLLVDNLDMIFEQIDDEHDEARLREVLMNDGAMMMIGCAISFFDEAQSYNKPLYNFFKTYDLARLKFEQIQELLLCRARLDSIENFEETLKANETRLRVLEYFTGGNPRLVLMLYRVITQSDISEVHRGLEKLLDEVTPYFKAKVESLPAQLRKILDHLARASSKTNEGLTPTQIAQAVRLPSNQVSSQLKRLSGMGYVRAANLRSRSSYYTLSEPLYAIWHQMRFGRDARERMRWLVNFLRDWYGAEEIGKESERLELRFHELLRQGLVNAARNVLEHRRYLAEAMDDLITRTPAIDAVIKDYLEMGEVDKLKEVLGVVELGSLPMETLRTLHKEGHVSNELLTDLDKSSTALIAQVAERKEQLEEIGSLLETAVQEFQAGRVDRSVEYLDRALAINPLITFIWVIRGVVLNNLGRYEDAVASFDRAMGIPSDELRRWLTFDNKLDRFGGHAEIEALIAELNSLVRTFEGSFLWQNRAVALSNAGKYEEALANFEKALSFNAVKPEEWRGRVEGHLGKFVARLNHGDELSAVNDWKEAVVSARHLKKDDWSELANSYLLRVAESGRFELTRRLLAAGDLNDALFPLYRAIDYLVTEDQAQIEKLSPEVRGIVDEIVTKLQDVTKKSQMDDKKTKSSKPSATEKSLTVESKPTR